MLGIQDSLNHWQGLLTTAARLYDFLLGSARLVDAVLESFWFRQRRANTLVYAEAVPPAVWPG